ncbi:MAG TPA: extracellular solute-binding protein [Thermomicrobiales bacterium]|nr:extracellular solute-binding protein [Thermomicrobiales bacterium]
MQRRTLLKRTGAAAGVAALGPAVLAYSPATVAAQDGATLEFWDTLNADPRKAIVESLAEAFANESDQVAAVEHRGWPLEELQETLPRVVDSNQGPAVAQVNNGESLMGPMIRAGQLVDISGYVQQYGWAEDQPDNLLTRNMYNEDGTQFGIGQLWGVSAEAEIVGIYYNRAILEEGGIEIPETLAGLEAAFEALADAGQTSLVFGNLDGWTAIHLFGNIHGTMTTRDYLDGIIYRWGGYSFEDESIINAAAKLQDWVSRGFLLEGFEGVSADDANALFEAGSGAMLMQGSWQAGSIEENLGGEAAGFFLTPPLEEGGTVLHVGGVGIPYSITSNAENPDLAAQLIDTLVSEEAFAAFIEAGLLPAGEIPGDVITEGTVSGELYTAWNLVRSKDAVGHYLDWAAPGFYDVLVSQLQQLLAIEVTPEEFASNLQDYYEDSFE